MPDLDIRHTHNTYYHSIICGNAVKAFIRAQCSDHNHPQMAPASVLGSLRAVRLNRDSHVTRARRTVDLFSEDVVGYVGVTQQIGRPRA